MLSRNNIIAAAAIANIAAGRGQMFAARGDSPLDILQHAMKPIMGTEDQIEEVYAMALDDAQGGLAVTPHSGEIDRLSSGTADRLSKNLAHIRNVINPLIRDIENECVAADASVKADNPLNISLVHVFVPEIYNSTALDSVLSIYSERTFTDPGMREQFLLELSDGIGPEDFAKMVKGPNTTLNDEIDAMIGQILGSGGTIPLWQRSPTFGKGLYCNFGTAVTFLFLKSFIAGGHPTIRPDDLESEDRVYVSRLLGWYGKLLREHLEIVSKDLSGNSNFVFLDPNDTKKIYVHDAKYTRWLENGGSLEAVIGHFYNAKTQGMDLGDMMSNPEKYVRIFERAEKIQSGITRNLSNQNIERITKTGILDHIVENHSDIQQRTLWAQETHAWFKENRLYANESCRNYILRAVTQILGRAYDAYLVLTEMECFLNQPENEAMEMNDAALFAVTRLLGRWLASMVHTTRSANMSPSQNGAMSIGPDNLEVPKYAN